MILTKLFLGPRLQIEQKKKVQKEVVVSEVPPVKQEKNDDAEFIKSNEVETDTSQVKKEI